MCKFCEFKGEYGEYFAMDKYIDVPDDARIAVESHVARYQRIRLYKGAYLLTTNMPYEDAKGELKIGAVGMRLFYCPQCGRKLDEKKYRVEGWWIHPHKDSVGESVDDLGYDDAMKIYKEWQRDNIHKNVNFCESELPF